MAYIFIEQPQAKLEANVVGASNKENIPFASATATVSADNFVTAANKLFGIAGKAIAVDGAKLSITKEATDNG